MRGFASRSSLALPVTNPYLIRDPPNFLTDDAEVLEEFLTDEPLPLRSRTLMRLTSLVPFALVFSSLDATL